MITPSLKPENIHLKPRKFPQRLERVKIGETRVNSGRKTGKSYKNLTKSENSHEWNIESTVEQWKAYGGFMVLISTLLACWKTIALHTEVYWDTFKLNAFSDTSFTLLAFFIDSHALKRGWKEKLNNKKVSTREKDELEAETLC